MTIRKRIVIGESRGAMVGMGITALASEIWAGGYSFRPHSAVPSPCYAP
jgi:hypothetical protein